MAKKGKKRRAKKKVSDESETSSDASDEFEWQPNLCCVATYRVLEGNDKLDQFEEDDLPFDDAPDKLLSGLRYYPGTTANRDIIELVSFEIARRFLKLLVLNFTVTREKDVSSAQILRALAREFASATATIKTLAGTVDRTIRFGDEVDA
jgi:hypothetical protein